MSAKRVAILVDNRWRDLNIAGLIAFHLERQGVQCFLEPLEAWRAVLPAYRPHLILFNHLLTTTLAAYSRRLHAMGVQTAVLPNEGIFFDAGELEFNAAKFHNTAHVDLFFCWNRVHRDALLAHGGKPAEQLHVVGVPRFDFYFAPWSHALYAPSDRSRSRPRLLVCTNFVLARFASLPPLEAEKLFAPWKDRVPSYRDYWGIIHASARGQRNVLAFLDRLAGDPSWDLVVRPHPNENLEPYQAWWEGLPPAHRQRVTLDRDSNFSSVLMDCDLEIACETCTTSMESWIVGKPTIELTFERHPVLHHAELAVLQPTCEDPAQLCGLARENLHPGAQARFREGRIAFLEKWCDSPSGRSSEKVARLIAERLATQAEPDWRQLTFTDTRRAAKLRLLRRLDLPYNYNPLRMLLSALFPQRYGAKRTTYAKTPKPADVRRVGRLFREIESEGVPRPR